MTEKKVHTFLLETYSNKKPSRNQYHDPITSNPWLDTAKKYKVYKFDFAISLCNKKNRCLLSFENKIAVSYLVETNLRKTISEQFSQIIFDG